MALRLKGFWRLGSKLMQYHFPFILFIKASLLKFKVCENIYYLFMRGTTEFLTTRSVLWNQSIFSRFTSRSKPCTPVISHLLKLNIVTPPTLIHTYELHSHSKSCPSYTFQFKRHHSPKLALIPRGRIINHSIFRHLRPVKKYPADLMHMLGFII